MFSHFDRMAIVSLVPEQASYMLLYTDDTVLLAESAEELQAALNAMFLYCKTLNLSVNTAKTKIVVFDKSNYRNDYVFLCIMVRH